ncbi:MAG: AzlD domain-containing protein [Rhizobiales bacterium]|nr:AzlD domain-containing protein [Hyphomicrobiales bacterium]
MTVDPYFFLAIVLMGLATYGTRLSGYLLLRGLKIEGRVKAAIDAVPPAILTAVIAPAVFLQGWAEMIAGAVTLGVALLRAPLLVTIGAGVASVVALRHILM